MKRAILYRFIGVLLLALLVSSIVSYFFVERQLRADNVTNMLHTINVVDYALDYEGDLQTNLRNLYESTLEENIRVSIIGNEGTVWADTGTLDITLLSNHFDREEIQHTIEEGTAYSIRYSETLKQNMMYVASLSQKEDCIIRMAVPYDGIFTYMVTIFPTLLAGTVIGFCIAIVLAAGFANTITEPLKKISDEMKNINYNNLDFTFEKYKYEELNVISDTTLKLSEEIREHLQQLEVEKKIRQKFFSNASHELKTPITSIKGYADLLDKDFVQDEVTKKDFYTRILKETDNMANLINDILMISRLEAKEAEVTFSMIRMVPLLDEILQSLEPIASEHEVCVHKEYEPITIEASAKQLQELLTNLISNGIMYSKPGGNVWVQISKVGESMQIVVKDDGMGISLENQERIFERFYRVDKGRSKKMGGTGLGLSIVKHIVEFYEGSIHLISKEGEGSTFTIMIPMHRTKIQLQQASL